MFCRVTHHTEPKIGKVLSEMTPTGQYDIYISEDRWLNPGYMWMLEFNELIGWYICMKRTMQEYAFSLEFWCIDFHAGCQVHHYLQRPLHELYHQNQFLHRRKQEISSRSWYITMQTILLNIQLIIKHQAQCNQQLIQATCRRCKEEARNGLSKSWSNPILLIE
jgi:hypothetical protein